MGNNEKSKSLTAPIAASTSAQKKRSAPSAASSAAKLPVKARTNSEPTSSSKGEPSIKRTRFESSPRKVPTSKPAPQPAKRPIAVAAPVDFVCSVGSYERLLYGLRCRLVALEDQSGKLRVKVEPIFSFPAHLSSIKSLSSSLLPSPSTGSERKVGGKLLVSGGTDEIVKVWDLKRRKEIGVLETGEMSGTITCLKFVPERGMLIASTTDSTIALYRVRDWVLLRALKGHKGSVNSVDPHPAGRVALSVGSDKMLRMWDLVAGKAVATLKIGLEGDIVKWNTDGTKFAIICSNKLTVYSIEMTVLHCLIAPSRFHDVKFTYYPLDKPLEGEATAQKEWMLVGCEDGQTRVFDISNPSVENEDDDFDVEEGGATLEPVANLNGHTNRVKQIDLLEVALPVSSGNSSSDSMSSSSISKSTMIISTISSDGFVNFYNLSELPSSDDTAGLVNLAPIGRYDTQGSRLTCMSVVGMMPERRERKDKNGEGADDDDDDEDESEAEDSEEVEGDEDEGEDESDTSNDDEEETDEEWAGIREDEEEFEGIDADSAEEEAEN